MRSVPLSIQEKAYPEDTPRVSSPNMGNAVSDPVPAAEAVGVPVRWLTGRRTLSTAILISAVVAGGLCWPMLFTNSSFGGDWLHHLWFIWHQSLDIRANHVPSLFLDTSFSVYYPQYAFYGATLYAFAGALALIPGSSPATAYVFTYLLGMMGAYWGWYWIGRLVGLGRLTAHAAGLAFVTSAAYLTMIYGRGDWPEFIGVSMIPLMVASGISAIRANRLSLTSALALAGSSIVFFGSHNLTILWGGTLLGITAGIALACVPAVRRRVRRRGVARVAGLIVSGMLVNAWYLLPAVVYASRTSIGHNYEAARQTLRGTMAIVAWPNLLTLSRATSIYGIPSFALSLPVLVIAWAIVSIPLVLYTGRRSMWAPLLVIFSGITVALVVLMTHLGLLLALPRPYDLLQFSYRLEGYVLLGLSAVVLSILVLAQNGSRLIRLWRWTIVPVLAVSAIGAIQQVDAYPRAPSRGYVTLGTVGETFAQTFRDFSDTSLPTVESSSLPELNFTPRMVRHDKVSALVRLRAGQRISTNIDTGPYLVHVTGAEIVGRNQNGFLVLAVGPNAPVHGVAQRRPDVQAKTISVSPAEGLPIVLGRILTLVGVVIVGAQMLVLSISRRQRSA